MDVLANVISATRIGNAILCGAEFEAPWGIRLDQENRTYFHIVSRGTCWLRLDDGSEPLQLFQGDAVLVPVGGSHILSDLPKTPALPLAETLACSEQNRPHKESSPPDNRSTSLICGGYQFEHEEKHPLLSLLPRAIHFPADKTQEAGSLQTIFRLLRSEVTGRSPGSETVVSRLVDVLFVYMLRAWMSDESACSACWLTALKDPQIGKSLSLMHQKPQENWTVETLAGEVLMSRAVFAKKFSELVGEPPLSYLTRWRMGIAARSLRESQSPLRMIAQEVGYEAEFSFSKAFKRVMGLSPGQYRAREMKTAR